MLFLFVTNYTLWVALGKRKVRMPRYAAVGCCSVTIRTQMFLQRRLNSHNLLDFNSISTHPPSKFFSICINNNHDLMAVHRLM
jgi:hypothetical protein